MKSIDILKKFNHRFGSMHDLDANVFTTDEITEAINLSMIRLLKEYVDNYETNENVRIALKMLTVGSTPSVNASPSYELGDNSTVYTLPEDCFAIVYAEADIVYDESETPMVADDRILAKPIKHDYYAINKENPYKKPYRKLAWYLTYDEGIEVISDGTYSILVFYIRYIKNPTLFNVMTDSTVEFNTKEIDIIVDMAVAKAFEFLINNSRIKGSPLSFRSEEKNEK